MKLAPEPRIVNYHFDVKKWPPPASREHSKQSLFGIDSDNHPYIIRWEDKAERAGWVAATLQGNKAAKSTATPQSLTGDVVGRVIKWWAETPLLASTVEKAKKKQEDE